jgi:hypothetical protein
MMKTTIKNNRQAVLDHLNDLSNDELVRAHDQYCENSNDPDNEIYYNDEEFFNTFFSQVMDAVRAIAYGKYNYADEFVKFNGYANLETTNDPADWIDLSEIAEDILECPADYDIELEEEEEEEEED